jgi:hypothetical protein
MWSSPSTRFWILRSRTRRDSVFVRLAGDMHAGRCVSATRFGHHQTLYDKGIYPHWLQADFSSYRHTVNRTRGTLLRRSQPPPRRPIQHQSTRKILRVPSHPVSIFKQPYHAWREHFSATNCHEGTAKPTQLYVPSPP